MDCKGPNGKLIMIEGYLKANKEFCQCFFLKNCNLQIQLEKMINAGEGRVALEAPQNIGEIRNPPHSALPNKT